MFKFYKDLTLYALLFSLVCIPLVGLYSSALVFGAFGTPVGLLMFRYFHKHEFYGYYNLGFSQRELILRTWLYNIILTPILLLFSFIALKIWEYGAM